MNPPDFLSDDEVRAIHREQLDAFGGLDGVRDEGLLQSALASPQNVFMYYAGADIYDVAAAYAFAISQDQPFIDGNKRTGLNAALLFLFTNGAKLPRDDQGQLFDAMKTLAVGGMTRAGLADVFRANV